MNRLAKRIKNAYQTYIHLQQLQTTTHEFPNVKEMIGRMADTLNASTAGMSDYFPNYVDYVYVLRLDANNIYVGTSKKLEKRLFDHFHQNGSLWTKKHKPIEVLMIIKGDRQTEKQIAANVMHMYPYDKVRGGPWCTDIINNLPKNEPQFSLRQILPPNAVPGQPIPIVAQESPLRTSIFFNDSTHSSNNSLEANV